MKVKAVKLQPQGDLVIDRRILEEAGLKRQVKLLVQDGEIRILPEDEVNPEKILDELAGCLGSEPAGEYDFGLEVGGLYEAR